MEFNVTSEIYLKKANRCVDIRIIDKKQTELLTSIPKLSNNKIYLTPNEETTLSYFFGEFVYNFIVRFVELVSYEGTRCCLFEVIDVEIGDNKRIDKRKNVEYPAVFFNVSTNGIDFATILDLSNSGMRIRTESLLTMKEIEIQYKDGTEEKIVRGEIVWEKQHDEYVEYGIKFS